MNFVVENWLALALLSAAAYALCCLVDVCFVGWRVFRMPIEGPIVSGLVCIVPLLLFAPAALDDLPVLESGAAAASIGAGAFYMAHLYFYFRALFLLNDAANAEVFNNLSVMLVPLLAFVLLGERLAPLAYIAIGLAAAGVIVFMATSSGVYRQAVPPLVAAAATLSVSMVLQACALESAAFGSAVVLFSAACFGTAVLLSVASFAARQRALELLLRFGPLFLGIELVELAALIASQRATDIGPSVSLVALAETTLPVMVVVISGALMLVTRRWSRIPPATTALLGRQLHALPAKCASMVLIGVAVVIASQTA